MCWLCRQRPDRCVILSLRLFSEEALPACPRLTPPRHRSARHGGVNRGHAVSDLSCLLPTSSSFFHSLFSLRPLPLSSHFFHSSTTFSISPTSLAFFRFWCLSRLYLLFRLLSAASISPASSVASSLRSVAVNSRFSPLTPDGLSPSEPPSVRSIGNRGSIRRQPLRL